MIDYAVVSAAQVDKDPWQKMMNDADFSDRIASVGYYQSPLSFELFKEKYDLHLPLNTPSYLSIDFWSRQSKTLTDRGLYVVRTGRGNFVILDEARFPRPYVQLTAAAVDDAIELDAKEISGFSHLKQAFKQHWQENANLEYLHLTDVYQQMVKRVCNASEFCIGPRGNRGSTFDMSFKSKSGEVIRFAYRGQEELDYTIWAEDTVLVFEAKQFVKPPSHPFLSYQKD